MTDSYGRNIEYLRISLTGRCNMCCIYCRDEVLPDRGREISVDEIERILAGMVSLGINKVRLTGGEPLLREDLEEIVGRISASGVIRDLCMTTNAAGLAGRVKALRQAGLMRLNISLDSLRPDRYREITRGGNLPEVLEAIDAAMDAGLSPIKINCVPLRGINEDEIDAFIDLARTRPLHVRFIEMMPIGGALDEAFRVRNQDILDAHRELTPVPPAYPGQPAENYTVPGGPSPCGPSHGGSSSGEPSPGGPSPSFRGTVGFISPISRPFCNDCNRVRLTSDGKLRPCLGDNTEADILAAMEQGDEEMVRVIRETLFNKPEGHRFNQGFVTERRMCRIGG